MAKQQQQVPLFGAAIVAAAICICMLPTPAFASSCAAQASGKLCGPSSVTFYLQNTVFDVVANNTNYFTSVYGAVPNYTFSNPNHFGGFATFEDPLTVAASNVSAVIGVGQGFYVIDSLLDRNFFYVFTANITSGDLGSITIMGQMRDLNPLRYLSVVGGTGAYLGARGVATCQLEFVDRGPPARWTVLFDLDLYY